MALRGIVGRLLAPRATPQGPAFPSTVLEMRSYNLSRIMGVRGLPGLLLPTIVKGKVYGGDAGAWYRVAFPEPVGNPSVVCVGEGREGAITFREIERAGDVPAAAVSLTPDIGAKTISLSLQSERAIVDRLAREWGDWGIFNWIRDAIAWGVGRTLYWFQERIVAPNMRNAQDTVNSAISDFNWKVNDQAGRLVNSINWAIAQTNSRINAQIDHVRNRANQTLRDLYAMWGVSEDVALTPLHVRNVSPSGFEWQSYGDTTAYFIAIGD